MAANISFRNKLFHSILRNTRWGDIIDAFQLGWQDIKDELIFPIRDKFNFEQMDEADLRDMIFRLGPDLPTYDGYTNTISYFKKLVRTITSMVTDKASPNGYRFMFYVFNLLGNTWPIRVLQTGVFQPQRLWTSNLNSVTEAVLLDQEKNIVFYYIVFPTITVPSTPETTGLLLATLDSATAPVEGQFLFLDGNEILDYTVHFLLSYAPRFIENTLSPIPEWSSKETERALFDMTNQLKRKKEVPHFQKIVPIEGFTSGAVRTRFWFTEDFVSQFLQETIYIAANGNFAAVTSVELGTGGHTTVNAAITGTQTPLITLTLAATFTTLTKTANSLKFEDTITSESYSWENFPFSEAAFLNTAGDVILYSKFPQVTFHVDMLKTILFDVSLI